MNTNEKRYEVVENEVLLEYVNNKKKEFLEQYLDFSFQEYLEDVFCYSIENDDINNLINIGSDLIFAFNDSLLEDETFLAFTVQSHFRESNRTEVFGLSFEAEFPSKDKKKSTSFWYSLVIYKGYRNFDITLQQCNNEHAVLDSCFVGKPLSNLIERLRKEGRL